MTVADSVSEYVGESAKTEMQQLTITLEKIDDDGVERGALKYFIEAGYNGYYTENGLWSTLFGLVFWDIVFLPIPGAFFNEFQRGPADLSTPDFYLRRKHEIHNRLGEISRMDDVAGWILDRFDEKLNIANAFVSWKRVDRELLEHGLQHIPLHHITAILERIAKAPMQRTTGFPDLILFSTPRAAFPIDAHQTSTGVSGNGPIGDAATSYLLIEVKGPGDQIQRNQRRWFSFFAENSIPAVVARVAYET